MADFNLLGFAAFVPEMIHELDRAKHTALEQGALIIEVEAKRVIGTYDYGWPPLAASTLKNKSADTPLLETGELRDSITHTVTGDEAEVGSPLDKAMWHEMGTRTIPARSFLQGAAMRKAAEVYEKTGYYVSVALKT